MGETDAEAADSEEADRDDIAVDDIPAVESARPRTRRGGGVSLGALLLSLAVHMAAAAAVVRWVIVDRPPGLAIQGGTGSAEFGSAAGGGEGLRDPLAELPGSSSSGARTSVPTPLPDMSADVAISTFSHATEDLLPQGSSTPFPSSPVPAPNTTARFPQQALNAPPASGAHASNDATGRGAAPRPVAQAGAGGVGGSGAGGGAGQSGSGGPVGLPGNRQPSYPVYELRHGITGSVRLRILVLEDGSVGDVSILEKSGRPAMDESAVKAVRGWHWSPAVEGGVPARVVVFQVIRFGESEPQSN